MELLQYASVFLFLGTRDAPVVGHPASRRKAFCQPAARVPVVRRDAFCQPAARVCEESRWLVPCLAAQCKRKMVGAREPRRAHKVSESQAKRTIPGAVNNLIR